jgi:hypothetical protein
VHAPHELQVDLAKPATAKTNHGWCTNWYQIQYVQEKQEMCTEFFIRKSLGRDGDLRTICILRKQVERMRWEEVHRDIIQRRAWVLNFRFYHQRVNRTERIVRNSLTWNAVRTNEMKNAWTWNVYVTVAPTLLT